MQWGEEDQFVPLPPGEVKVTWVGEASTAAPPYVQRAVEEMVRAVAAAADQEVADVKFGEHSQARMGPGVGGVEGRAPCPLQQQQQHLLIPLLLHTSCSRPRRSGAGMFS